MTFKNVNLLKIAEIAKFNPDERMDFEESVKIYRDLKNSIDTAREEGSDKRAIEIAKSLKMLGVDIKTIQESTGLSKGQIEKL